MPALSPPLVRHRAIRSLAIVMGTMMILAVSSATATVWHVDGGNAACSNAGPGDAANPFCSIGAGAAAALAGDVVTVHPAAYREQVTPPRSGSPGAPITFEGTGRPLLLGTDDVSDPATWSPTATTAWSRHYAPGSAPAQVFLDGERLVEAPSAGATTPGSFFYDATGQLLYVDIGGAHPAVGHTVEAGARLYGFRVVTGRTDLTISGFDIRGQNHSGIRVFDGNSGILLEDNEVSATGVYGIALEAVVPPLVVRGNRVSGATLAGIRTNNAVGVLIEDNLAEGNGDHGISILRSSDFVIQDNLVRFNARPVGIGAAGINIESSVNNLMIRNEVHDNQDAGLKVRIASVDNLVVRNLCHHNGDHGYHALLSTGTRFVSNTAYGNVDDGFAIEAAPGTSLFNNIAMDNGVASGDLELLVDPGSTTGFVSDYNIFHKSSPGRLVRHDGTFYDLLADFVVATGNEVHGIQGDPRFEDVAKAKFTPLLGPATDSADAGAGGFEMVDQAGRDPFDLPSVADTGAGEPPYADRGALELIDRGPQAMLKLSPQNGVAPLVVTADASSSRDDLGLSQFLFDFGDGTLVEPQASPEASHTYTEPGRYDVTVTVTSLSGLQDSTVRSIKVRGGR